MKEVSFMDSFNGSNMRTVEVQKILEEIKKGFWEKQIKEIQHHFTNGDIDKANDLKKNYLVLQYLQRLIRDVSHLI